MGNGCYVSSMSKEHPDNETEMLRADILVEARERWQQGFSDRVKVQEYIFTHSDDLDEPTPDSKDATLPLVLEQLLELLEDS